MQNSLGGALL